LFFFPAGKGGKKKEGGGQVSFDASLVVGNLGGRDDIRPSTRSLLSPATPDEREGGGEPTRPPFLDAKRKEPAIVFAFYHRDEEREKRGKGDSSWRREKGREGRAHLKGIRKWRRVVGLFV